MKRLWCGIIMIIGAALGIVAQMKAQNTSPTPITTENATEITSLATFPTELEESDGDIQWSPDGRTIAIAMKHGAQAFDLSQSTDKASATFGKNTWAKCVDYVPDRTVVATCSALSSTVWLWDRHTDKLLATLANGDPKNVLEYARFSPNGHMLAVINGFENGVYIWGVNDGADPITPDNAQKIKLMKLLDHGSYPIDMSFSPDGSSLATVSNDKTLRIWDLVGMKLSTSQAYEDDVWALAYSPDGQWLAVGWDKGGEGHVRLLNLADASIRRDFKPLQTLNFINDLNFSADGKLLVSAQGDGSVTLWDVNGGVALYTINTGSRTASQAAINHDGTLVATLNIDKGVEIWGLADALSTIPQPTLGAGMQAWVKSPLNLRTEAGTKADQITQLKGNTVVTVIDGPQDVDGVPWWKVRNASGAEGWVIQAVGKQEILVPDT